MTKKSSLHDLVENWTRPDYTTVHEVATTPVLEGRVEIEHPDISARMPGDEAHPLGGSINPMPELGGPLAILKALREGQIPPHKIRAVRAYLNLFHSLDD